jgi:hypothetical protein
MFFLFKLLENVMRTGSGRPAMKFPVPLGAFAEDEALHVLQASSCPSGCGFWKT